MTLFSNLQPTVGMILWIKAQVPSTINILVEVLDVKGDLCEIKAVAGDGSCVWVNKCELFQREISK